MSNTLISVIVPVYNAELFLDKCLENIVSQTYHNVEILLIDDGSTDNSAEKCKEWTKKDKRIRLIQKENGGASTARNKGIEEASGDYLIFIDSDDYWQNKDFLNESMSILEKTNGTILIFGYEEVNTKGEHRPKLDFSFCDDIYKMYTGDFCIEHGLLVSSPCTKIVKRSFIVDNNIFFRPNVRSEDIEWNARIIALVDDYCIYPKNVYAYYQNEQSVTHNITENDVNNLVDNIERCLNLEKQYSITNKNVFLNYVAYQYITTLNLYLLFTNHGKDMKKKLKKYRWLLNYHKNKKVDLIYKFNKYFGFEIMTKVLYLFLKIRKTGR